MILLKILKVDINLERIDMRNKMIILLFIVSNIFGYEWIEYNSSKINSKVVVVKIKKDIAPLLGIENPITLEKYNLFSELGISNFSPLFMNYKNFSYSHYQFGLHQYYRIDFNNNIDFNMIQKELEKIEIIELVEPSYIKSINIEPNDQYYSEQWAHQNTGQAVSYNNSYVGTLDCDTDTNDAWDISTGSEESIIAILDTGVSNHSEFSGRMVQGYNFINNNYDATDDQGHGTSCAGISAAEGNNLSGIAGVCWDCKIMPVKVLDSFGYGDDTGISNGIEWAANNNADVISMSLGGGGYVSYTDSAINFATEEGTVVFAASGNDNTGSLSYPSGYSNCISVGALSPCNERKNISSCDGENFWGSNYGNGLDFLAPGVRIHTTTMSGGYTSTFNGTSSACPHAAGIAGLIRSESNNISAYDIRLLMQQSSDDIGAIGYDTQTGYGRVNAYNSLFNLLYNPEAFVDIESINIEASSSGNVQEAFVIANIGETDLEFNIDSEGYAWKTSENSQLSYEWIDISAESTQMTFTHNDYASDEIITLDFDFPFYNSSYSSLIVNPNGWIGFGDDNIAWDNTTIPNSDAPAPAIFGFWDDLNPINSSSTGEGNVYYNSNSARLVVWFDNVQHWPTNFEGSIYDFQIVLYASGEIKINYRSMQGLTNSATIGIQNSNAQEATLVNYNFSLVQDQFSILIYKMPSWLEVTPLYGVVSPGDASEILLNINTDGLSDGLYLYDLTIETNDYENSLITIPISLNVLEGACSEWSAGDLNQDAQLNILDITITVNLALGLLEYDECQFLSADLNADQEVNILDILNLVNLILN